MLAVGDCNPDQMVVFVQIDRDDAALHRTGEIIQGSLLHRAIGGGEEYIFILDELAHRQHRVDLLASFQRQQIHDRPAARNTAALRHFIDLEPIHAAAIGETQNVIMGIGDEQIVDEIVFLGRGGLLAATAAFLRFIFVETLRLHVAAMRQRDHYVFRRNQVFHAHVLGVRDDLAAALVAELRFHRNQFVVDDLRHALRLGKDVEQVGNLVHHFAVFADDLVLLQTGQALQAQFQNRLCLRIGEMIAARLALSYQAELRCQTFGTRRIADTAQHVFDQRRTPRPRHQFALRVCGCRRSFDQGDDLIHIRQRHRQAFQNMAALACLAQFEEIAARDHFAAMTQERIDHLLEVEQPGLTVNDGNHVDAETVLQLGIFVQLVKYHIGVLAALQLDHRAHPGLVRFVADFGDAFQTFLAHHLADLDQQVGLVHLVGQLVDDDGLTTTALVQILEVGSCAHHHAAAPGAIAFLHAGQTVDETCGRKIRGRHIFNQLLDIHVGILQQCETGIHHLVQIVRRDVGRHAHRDTGRAVHQQVGEA